MRTEHPALARMLQQRVAFLVRDLSDEARSTVLGAFIREMFVS
jgi:hypothetical protein